MSGQFLKPSPSAVQGGVDGPVGAGPCASVPQFTLAASGLASGTVQPMQLSMSSNTRSFATPVPQLRAPELAPSSLTRPFSEVDDLYAQNTQVGPLTQHALKNHWQSTQGAYTPFPDFSLATSSAQYPVAGPEYVMPGPSSHSRRDSSASLFPEDPIPLSPSSGLRDGFVSSAALSPRLASTGAAGHALPQQATSSAVAEARGKRRTTGKRKRAEIPKDWRAAQRLQNQREEDNKNLDFLFKLFVPSSAGTVETVPKKDRISLSTS